MGDRGGAWGCALGFDGAFRALRDAGWGQSGGCRRLRHTCVAGVLGAARALWGSGPGTKLPSSLDTKAADDADVPDFGVCLVQFTQLLGGGTGVRASGILSGRAIRHGQETTLLFDYHPLSPQGHVAGGPSAARRPSSGEKWPRGVRACTCGMIVAHSRLILTYASLSALEPNPLCAQAAGVSGKGKKADKITGRLEKCARNTQELSQSKKDSSRDRNQYKL